MPITFSCPCGKKYRTREEQAGKQFKCKSCGEVISIPPAEATASSPSEPEPAAEPLLQAELIPDSVPSAAIPQPSATKKKKPNALAWIVLASVLGPILMCGGACGGCYYMALSFGKQMIESGVEKKLAVNPVIQQQIGEIESCTMRYNSLSAANKTRRFVFHLKGSKGTGKAIVVIPEQESEDSSVICFPQTLETSDGIVYDLTR